MNKITPEHIQSIIDHEVYFLPGHKSESTLTICVLTLQNGFDVTGESACCSRDIYDMEKGKEIARANAVEKIWALEGYLLKQTMMCAAEADHELISEKDHEENEQESETESEVTESEETEESSDNEKETQPEAAESTQECVIDELIQEPTVVAISGQ